MSAVANFIYLGFAHLMKALGRHKASLHIQNGSALKRSFDIFKS